MVGRGDERVAPVGERNGANAESRPAKRAHRADRPWRRRRRPRLWRRRRRVPPLSVAPTLCTLGNLVAGVAAIHYATRPFDFTGLWGWSSLTLAGVLIFLGMVFDAIDGSLARLTRSTSELGAQLDSLADMVTFGLAPAFMVLQLGSFYLLGGRGPTIIGPEVDAFFARLMWAVVAVYVCCTALRLARFNVETPAAAVENHLVFRGLPSPAAAGAVAGLIVFHQHVLFTEMDVQDMTAVFARGWAFGMPAVALLCAFGMISSLPYTHVVNRYLRGKRSFTYVAWLVVGLALAVWWPQEALAVGFTAYALSAPARPLLQTLRRRLSPPQRGRGAHSESHGP